MEKISLLAPLVYHLHNQNTIGKFYFLKFVYFTFNSTFSDLSDKYEWNLLGSVPSQQSIDFPTDYAEIQICITNANEPYLTYVYNFCKPFIQSIGVTSRYFGQGYYKSNTDYQSCQLGMNMYGCYLQNLSAVGTNYTSGCALTVYYR